MAGPCVAPWRLQCRRTHRRRAHTHGACGEAVNKKVKCAAEGRGLAGG